MVPVSPASPLGSIFLFVAFLLSQRGTESFSVQSQSSSYRNLINIFTLSWKVLLTPPGVSHFKEAKLRNKPPSWTISGKPRVGEVFRASECKEARWLLRALRFRKGHPPSSPLPSAVRAFPQIGNWHEEFTRQIIWKCRFRSDLIGFNIWKNGMILLLWSFLGNV